MPVASRARRAYRRARSSDAGHIRPFAFVFKLTLERRLHSLDLPYQHLVLEPFANSIDSRK